MISFVIGFVFGTTAQKSGGSAAPSSAFFYRTPDGSLYRQPDGFSRYIVP